MDINQLLAEAEQSGVLLYVEDEKLKYKAKKDGLPDFLKQKLKEHKQEIISCLNNKKKQYELLKAIPALDKAPEEARELSYAQQRMWFLNQFIGPNSVYNIPLLMHFDKTLDPEALIKALTNVLSRHEVLRSTFHEQDNKVAITVDTTANPIELESFATTEEIDEICRQEAHYKFDLIADKPCRIRVIHNQEKDIYLLSIVLHHSVSDGWSQSLMLNEIHHGYDAFVQQKQPSLEPLAIQYSDFAHWQRNTLSDDIKENQLPYWRNQLAELPAKITLPHDFLRPTEQTYNGSLHAFEVPFELVEKLEQLSHEQSTTMFMTMFSTFALLLHDYSGLDDIGIGTPIANRNRKELESLMGFFVNTLVLRSEKDSSLTFKDFLSKNREMILGGFGHQDVPFEMLVDELVAERDLSHSPLFQVMFMMHNLPENDSDDTQQHYLMKSTLDDYNQDIDTEHNISHFELTLTLKQTKDGMRGAFEYNTDLFKRSTIERFTQYYIKLLKIITEKPEKKLVDINVLPEGENELLLKTWNDTAVEYPENTPLANLFEESVKRSPHSIAIVDDETEYSYGYVNQKANQLAHYLNETGVGPEVAVGVYLNKSIDTIIALLAIIKAGGYYLPLDTDYPDSRLQMMLEENQVTKVLTHSLLTPSKELKKIEGIEWLDINVLGQNYSTDNLKLPVSGSNTAYVVYTSGSTGKPKGVAVSHNNITSLFAANSLVSVTPKGAVAQLSNYSFDAFTYEFWATLLTGATLVMIDKQIALDPNQLETRFKHHNVTDVFLTTALFNRIAMENPSCFSDLEKVLFGGEACSLDAIEHLLSTTPPRKLIHVYGPTESTTFTTGCEITRDYLLEHGKAPIGGSLSNRQVYILNNDHLAPIGVTGELCIGGKALSRGYVGNPGLTAEKFVPDLYSNIEGATLYRTGDLARYLPDGNIEFVGRVDHQVKIRGFRIEPSEISTVLQHHKAVNDAIVLVKQGPNGNKYLVSYVVAADKTEDYNSLSVQLTEYLTGLLPAYMIPTAITCLDALPLTPNGKLDRSSLPDPIIKDNENSYIAPQTAIEKELCQAWQDLFGLDKVGIDDNFFAIGGDSIISIQLVSKLKQQGIALSVKQLFEHQTIRKLAKVVKTSFLKIDQRATSGQQQLIPVQNWYLTTNGDAPNHFHQSQILTLPESFSAEFLHKLVTALYQRHDALRLTFSATEKVWQSNYVDFSDELIKSSILTIDYSEHNESSFDDFVKEQGYKIKSEFDISCGPLFKVVHFNHLNDVKQSKLMFALHHIIVDGVSWRILMQDLVAAFDQWSSTRQINLGEKTTSYQKWGSALKEYAYSDAVIAETDYWLEQEQSLHHPLPLDFPATEVIDTHANSNVIALELEKDVTQLLLAKSNVAYNTGIQDILLSALLDAYKKWTGQNEIGMLLEGHGREDLFEDIDLSETIGWFTNVYPQKLTIPSLDTTDTSKSLGTLIKSTKEQLRQAPNKGMGYGLLKYLNQESNLFKNNSPIKAPFVFNYLGQFDKTSTQEQAFATVAQNTGSDIGDSIERNYYLGLNGLVIDGRLSFKIDYNPGLHKKSTVEGFVNQYKASLIAIIEHCSSADKVEYTPSDFPTLHDLEQDHLDAWQEKYPTLETVYPVTRMQQGFIFHSLLDDNPESYASQLYLDFEGDFKPELFQQAWNQLIVRHAIFRTAYVGFELSQPVQLVINSNDLEWQLEDWSHLDDSELSTTFNQYIRQEKCKGFDFSQPPLMRMSLLKLAPNNYRWLWTHHHSILDGWSLPIVFQELFALYNNLNNSVEQPLPAVTPFADYVNWLARRDTSAAKDFWHKELETITEATVLPSLPLQESTVTSKAGVESLLLSEQLSQQLREKSTKHDVSINILIQAAWAILLWRYADQDEVVFGQTVSGRPEEVDNIERMVGMCINTVPVPVSFDSNANLTDFLTHLHERHLSRMEHVYLPLVDIQKQSQLAGDSALFDTLLVIQNYPVRNILNNADSEDSNQLGFRLSDIGSDVGTNYGLTLVVSPDNQIDLKFDYLTAQYDASTVTQLLDSLQSIFEAMVDSKTTTLASIKFNENHHHAEQLFGFNDTATDLMSNDCVHRLFEQQAVHNAQSLAVECQGQELTYKELNEQSNALAHYMLEKGVKRGEPVALVMDESIDIIVSIMAVLKAGAAYLPVDPGYPQSRIDYVLEDSRASFVITNSNHQEKIPQGIATVCLDSLKEDSSWASYSTSNITQEQLCLTQSDLAYVLYTSGSTGMPKGVMVSHGNLMNYLTTGVSYMHQDITGSIVSSAFVFDATVCPIFIPLVSGKSIELLPQDTSMLENLVDCLMDDSEHLLFKLTPAHLRALLNMDFLDTNEESQHVLVIGGEQLLQETLNKWQALLPQSLFINEYGPTEATVGCSIYKSHSVETPFAAAVSIGTPIGNTELYVLDKQYDLKPFGMPGQLAIAGKSVTMGYLGKAALTAEKFIPNPYSSTPGERLYLTGDHVRHLPDANLQYLGRIDEQVKIRGRRVELGEIESQLQNVAMVSEATVLVKQDAEGETHLVAYIVTDTAQSPDNSTQQDTNNQIGDIKLALAKLVPDYMVPDSYHLLDQMPLTRNGKVDKKALQNLNNESKHTQQYVAPRNSTEQAMSDLWQRILDVEKIGIHDDFFSLGGHSILAMRLISAIREEFAVELTLRALFDSPTIAGLSEQIHSTNNQFVLPEVAAMDRNQLLPLSFAQQRMWFIDQLNEGSTQYNMAGVAPFEGELDLSALQKTVDTILQRHEVLRTCFKVIDEQAYQVIQNDFHLPIETHDLTSYKPDEQVAKFHQLFHQGLNTPFDLSQDILLRVKLVKILPDVQIVIYTTHHISSDGWSMDLLNREFVTLYEAYRNNKPNPLQDLTIQYADYAVWQRDWLKDEVLEEQLGYWRSQLKDVPAVHNLPLDYRRPRKQTFSGKVHQQSLDLNTGLSVLALCKEHNVTLFMFLETAFTVLLSRYSNETDIVIGAAAEGRFHKDIEQLIGFFINSVVLRTDLSGNPTFEALLQKNKKVVLDAYAHKYIPFEMLVGDISPERDLAYNPVFQMMFGVERLTAGETDNSVMPHRPEHDVLFNEIKDVFASGVSTRSDLQLQVIEDNGSMSISWIYNESLFDLSTIENMANSYAELLQSIISPKGMNKCVNDLSLLDTHQKQHLIQIGQGDITETDGNTSLHVIVQKQAEKTPHAIAVSAQGEELSYLELNEQSNQLARYLLKLGVKQGSIVGLCVDKSVEMILGILGILKSGAAYLPLDPELPAERLDFMLQDSSVQIVLTQQELLAEVDFGDCKSLPLDGQVFSMFTGHLDGENLSVDEVIYEPADIAYIIYTSGSTGQPKGVAVSHKAALIYCDGASSKYYQSSLDGSLVVTSYSFDMTVPSLYLPLMHGGTVHFLDSGLVLDSLSRHLSTTKNNYLLRMTPSHASALITLLDEGIQLDNKHTFVIGGETLHYFTISQLKKLFINARFINHYGPTEAVVGCVMNDSIVIDTFEKSSVPIGRPMPNMQVYVLDNNQQLQLPGSIGELAVAGKGLATGYVNDHALTDDRFVQDHIGLNNGNDKLYKTGDLVRWLSNGDLLFVGRKDDQVKIRGFRIELGDIESSLKEVNGIKDAAVAIKQIGNSKQQSLVAYVVTHEEFTGEDDLELHQIKTKEIKRYRESLSRKMPDYMIPLIYIFMESLPLTANGKVDKRNLPEPHETDLHEETYVAPHTEVEKTLCRLWEEILELEQVGIENDFFSLGGHSLLATSMISSIRQELGIQLPVRMVFEYPTIKEFANIVEAELLNQSETISAADEEEFVL